MKGLMESPKYTWPPYSSQVPLSLEFYYMYVCRVPVLHAYPLLMQKMPRHELLHT